MTKIELREAIKQEARVKTSIELDDFIDQIVQEITRDHTNKARYSETLKLDVAITPIAATGTYNLPADFQNLDVVRYARGPGSGVAGFYWRTILPFNTNERRRSIMGYPTKFILAGGKLNLHPYDAIAITDFISLDYYADLTINWLDDGPFPIPRLESTVKKETVARVQRFHLDFPSADRTNKDAGGSFIAAQS